MKHDEELQKKIERGEVDATSVEDRAYQKVFDVLKKEPDFHVSLPFADRVLARMEAEKSNAQRDYWWMAAGIFIAIAGVVVTLILTKAAWTTGVFTFVSGYRGLIIFGVAFILALQWVDKKLVRKQTSPE